MNRLLLGYSPDFDLFDDASKVEAATSPEHEGSVLESDHSEAATELLEAAGRPALPALLAQLLRGAAPAAGGTIHRAVEGELVKLLHRAARVALPTQHALTLHDGAARASRFFGIELEGLSPEDQEFESARRFVELVHAAAGHAAHASPRLPPDVAAWLAASRAAKRFAPGWSAALLATPSVTAGRTSRPHFAQGAHHA